MKNQFLQKFINSHKKNRFNNQEHSIVLNNLLRAKTVQTILTVNGAKRDGVNQSFRKQELQNNLKLYDDLKQRIEKGNNKVDLLNAAKEIAKTENLGGIINAQIREGKITKEKAIENYAKDKILSGKAFEDSVESILYLTEDTITRENLTLVPTDMIDAVKDCLNKNYNYDMGYGREYCAQADLMGFVTIMEKALGLQNNARRKDILEYCR